MKRLVFLIHGDRLEVEEMEGHRFYYVKTHVKCQLSTLDNLCIN